MKLKFEVDVDLDEALDVARSLVAEELYIYSDELTFNDVLKAAGGRRELRQTFQDYFNDGVYELVQEEISNAFPIDEMVAQLESQPKIHKARKEVIADERAREIEKLKARASELGVKVVEA